MRRRRTAALRRLVRGVLPLVIALAALSLTPLPASASTWGASVTPLLDCVAANSDGTYTAVIGYSSSYGSTVTIARGWNNYVSPSRYDGKQPTTFRPGTQHGVFALTVSGYDAWYSNPTWHVDGHDLSGWGASLSSSCPPPTQLPAEGNDAGAGIALVVAGVIGVVVVVRLRRRALAGAAGPAPREERVHA